jgi:uncharacterized protein YwlG (UPF0340 family)
MINPTPTGMSDHIHPVEVPVRTAAKAIGPQTIPRALDEIPELSRGALMAALTSDSRMP